MSKILSHSKLELEESHAALLSLLKKCEAAQANSSLSQSRQTLMKRRIAALKIALSLIEEKQEVTDEI